MEQNKTTYTTPQLSIVEMGKTCVILASGGAADNLGTDIFDE